MINFKDLAFIFKRRLYKRAISTVREKVLPKIPFAPFQKFLTNTSQSVDALQKVVTDKDKNDAQQVKEWWEANKTSFETAFRQFLTDSMKALIKNKEFANEAVETFEAAIKDSQDFEKENMPVSNVAPMASIRK